MAAMTGNAIREALEPFAKAATGVGAIYRDEDRVSHTPHVSMILTVGDLRRARVAHESIPADGGTVKALQDRVRAWTLECFGDEIACDLLERMDRFTEEALELVQSLGYTPDRAHALVDYVFGREAGEPSQETGGTMTTLAALCNVAGIDIEAAFRAEVERITTPAMVMKIRAKQAAKPTGSALPVALSTHTAAGAGPVGEVVARDDYLSDAQARELFGLEDDEALDEDRIRVCQGEWVRIPGGYYFDKSVGLLHPETANDEACDDCAVSIARPVEPGEVERLRAEAHNAHLAVKEERALADAAGAARPAGEPGEVVQVVWRAIEDRDQIVETIQTFGEVTLRNSHPVWVRDADGRVYEAVWTVDGRGRGYWWDTEGESPADPVAILPHPLTERAALTGDAQEAGTYVADAARYPG